MAIRINFDVAHNPEVPTIILAKKNGDKIGQLNTKSIEITDSLNDVSEITFVVHKYVDNKKCEWWEQIVDFKLIYCVEWDMWFEITVELDEATETFKTVYCKCLGHAELSQVKLFDVEINTESDIARDDYIIPTVLYNAFHPEASLLHRIMEKAPHYKVIHVDNTIASIQRTFTFSDTSIYDAFQEIAEEIHCLFVLHSNSDENGKIQRTISVYDLESNCSECGYRGEFTGICPNCGSSEVNEGYGNDTTIFITSDELANDIQLSSDTSAIKNCFKLEAGDDLMTATIRNCNPNGTDYIWYISESSKLDMSKDLVEKIKSYDSLNSYYQKDYISTIDNVIITKYNSLVEKYKIYNNDLEQISTPIKGYPELMNAYYNTIDLAIYLQSALMPSVVISDTNATEQALKLTTSNLSPVSVNTISDISLQTANNAVLSMAKVIVDSRYKVKVSTSSLERDLTYQIWTGNFTVTNYSDDTDVATSEVISVIVNDDYSSFVKQKIEKMLNKDDNEDLSISGLFKKSYDDFVVELKKYSLDYLNSFYNSCQSCIDILIEQGIGNEGTWSGEDPNLYEELYVAYLNKLSAIESEIKIRQEEIDLIIGVYDTDDELQRYGLQTYIEEIKFDIQKNLDFENYLGSDLWLEFCTFRREDKYSNSNYISDGLNNAELFNKAYEFVQVAQNEIYKSSELQHSITASLKNLLVMKKFLPLTKDFQVGNWLRIMIDDELYKLRLIKYTIDYDNLNDISVEFSDIVKANSSISSVQEVIEQATSMATSYSSVKRQAQQGEKSNSIINDWFSDGLDATNTKIIGGADNQSQTWDEHGMLFRKYDSVSETYDNEQLKIINSTIAITNDNWTTTKTAVGNFYYRDPVTKALKNAYGINGEVIIGKLLIGEGLGIYNETGSLTFDNKGLGITNGVNTFSVDPNNTQKLLNISNYEEDIFYVDNEGKLYIKGEIIATKGTIGNCDINDGILTVSDIMVKDLNENIILSTKKNEVQMSGWNVYDHKIINKKEAFQSDGFIGIYTSFKSGDGNINSEGNDGNTHAVVSEHIDKDWRLLIGGNFGVNSKGGLYASDATITGNIKATSGEIGGCKIQNGVLQINSANINSLSVDKISSGTNNNEITLTNATVIGSITATSGTIGGCSIDNNVLKIKNANIGEKLTADSIDATNLKVSSANITGTITANKILVKDSDGKNTFLSAGDNVVNIAGWEVDENSIRAGTLGSSGSMWLCRNGTSTSKSIGGSSSQSGWCIGVGSNFGVTKSGAMYASGAKISGDIKATSGEIGGWTIGQSSLSGTSAAGDIEIKPYSVKCGNQEVTWARIIRTIINIPDPG